MRTWKNYLCMLAALVVTLGFTSCESDKTSVLIYRDCME